MQHYSQLGLLVAWYLQYVRIEGFRGSGEPGVAFCAYTDAWFNIETWYQLLARNNTLGLYFPSTMTMDWNFPWIFLKYSATKWSYTCQFAYLCCVGFKRLWGRIELNCACKGCSHDETTESWDNSTEVSQCFVHWIQDNLQINYWFVFVLLFAWDLISHGCVLCLLMRMIVTNKHKVTQQTDMIWTYQNH